MVPAVAKDLEMKRKEQKEGWSTDEQREKKIPEDLKDLEKCKKLICSKNGR